MNGLMAVASNTAAGEGGLTAAGAVIMTLSILLVLGLAAFCMARILGEKHPEDHHHAPLDIDTHDTDS